MNGNQTFACPQCGKRFTWKPQYTGRKVSCGCGRVFEAMLGFEGAELTGDAYDVAADAPVNAPAGVAKASPPRRVPPPSVPAAAAYPRHKRAAAVESDDEANLDPEAANPLLHA